MELNTVLDLTGAPGGGLSTSFVAGKNLALKDSSEVTFAVRLFTDPASQVTGYVLRVVACTDVESVDVPVNWVTVRTELSTTGFEALEHVVPVGPGASLKFSVTSYKHRAYPFLALQARAVTSGGLLPADRVFVTGKGIETTTGGNVGFTAQPSAEGASLVDQGAPGASPWLVADSGVAAALGSPAQEPTLQAVGSVVSQVESAVQSVGVAIGSPAQQATLQQVDASVGQVATVLGSPAQEPTLQQVVATLGLPAQERVLASDPHAVRLSDGTAFYSGATEATLQAVGTSVGQVLSALGSPAQEHSGPADYQAVRLTDGVNFVTPTTPADTQTVSGTVTAGQGAPGATPWPVSDGGGSLTVDAPQLPASLGQQPSSGSTSVVLASDQPAVPVSDAGGSLTVDAPQLPPALAANRLVVDGSQVTQPVSDSGGSLTVDTLQLPAALVGGRLDSNVGAWLGSTAPSVGQKTASNSLPVTLASDQPSIAVAASGTVTANQGAAGGTPWPVSDAGSSLTVDTPQLPGALVGARLDTNTGAWLGSTAPTVGQKTSANSVPVVVSSDQSALPVSDAGGSLTVDSPQLPAALVGGRLSVDGSGVTQPVSDAGSSLTVDTPQLPAALVGGRLPVDGSGVTQPVSDAGGSLTVDSPQLPAALVGGRVDSNVGAWLGSTAPTVGQKLAASSIPVVLPASQSPTAVTTFGTSTAVPVSLLDGPNVDAAGRIRVGVAEVQFESKLLHDAAPILWDDQQVSGAGTTSTYSAVTNTLTMSVSAATAGRRVRQTLRRLTYQPGKSQLLFFTGVIGAPAAGIIREVGQTDGTNGVLFSSRNVVTASYPSSAVYVVVRSSTSGVTADTAVPQSGWNLDRLDGSGGSANPSGITLNFNLGQLFVIDYTWLSLGDVRFGFRVGGRIVYCHRFTFENVVALPWAATPDLPLRYSIENTGAGGAASLVQICSAVFSEASLNNTGYSFGVNRGATALTTNNDASIYPLIAIRLRSGYLGSTVRPTSITIACSSTAVFAWYLLVNPTVTGTALSFSGVNLTSVEADVARTNTTTLTPTGLAIATGVAQAASEGFVTFHANTQYAIGSTIAGVSEVLVLAVQRLTGAAETFYGALNWDDRQ